MIHPGTIGSSKLDQIGLILWKTTKVGGWGEAYLIFVTGTTGGARGEKICHVEKFQISIHDICGEILNLTTLGLFHMTNVEKSEISPHVE